MTRKKDTPIKRTSRKTGAIILISFCVCVSLILALIFYSWDFREKQLQEENAFRQMSCQEMLDDYSKENPKQAWKWTAIIDKTNSGNC